MISVGELISIFSELSTKNKKRLYAILFSVFSNHEEYKEIVDLLIDLKEDLLYSDKIDVKEEPYFTLEDFSIMTDLDIDTLEYLVKDLVPKVVDGTKTYSIRDFLNVYKKEELK
ncbi:MAG TPA: hypothetical protein PLK32_09170 [Defluviitoga tunisiensis]|nr:hypothetical protein [Defluviitoga tunisiensis]